MYMDFQICYRHGIIGSLHVVGICLFVAITTIYVISYIYFQQSMPPHFRVSAYDGPRIHLFSISRSMWVYYMRILG